MKKTLSAVALGLAFLFGAPNLLAQNDGRSTYWHQQQTLFAQLPTAQDDIIMLGNSITDGGEWAELLSNPRVKNRGISGDTTGGILQRLETITKGRPAMVFLLVGINDFSQGVSADKIVENIEQIILRIKSESPSTRLFVQSILPLNDHIDAFQSHKKHLSEIPETNARIAALCEKHKVGYLDLYSLLTDSEGRLDRKYTNDGLHLLGPGYLVWASVLKPLL